MNTASAAAGCVCPLRAARGASWPRSWTRNNPAPASGKPTEPVSDGPPDVRGHPRVAWSRTSTAPFAPRMGDGCRPRTRHPWSSSARGGPHGRRDLRRLVGQGSGVKLERRLDERDELRGWGQQPPVDLADGLGDGWLRRLAPDCAGRPLTRTAPSFISRAGSSRPGKRRSSKVSSVTNGMCRAAGTAGFSLRSDRWNGDRGGKEDHG